MIAVVGPGALGGLFAGLLAEAGEAVAVLARTAEQAERLRVSGLCLSGPGERPERPVSVRFLGPDDALPVNVDLALLCVKAKDTASALARVAMLQGGPAVLVLLNGLDRARVATQYLDAERVVGAVTTEGATITAEGRVRHAGRGKTSLAPLVPAAADRAARAARRLAHAGFDAEVVPDLDAVVWNKLQVNAAINALTGLLGCKNGVLLDAPTARALASEAALEVAAVARHLGIAGDWTPEASTTRWEAVARATADNVSSTLQDLRRGRVTEVSAINGALVREARERGLAAPINDALARLIAAAEEVAERRAIPSAR